MTSAPGPAAEQPVTDQGRGGEGAAAVNFEQALERLETLVAQLETGELPLDAALSTFEQGVRLTRECQAALGAAQQKVQVLLQRGETTVVEDFALPPSAPP